jgi:hypothetical protein
MRVNRGHGPSLCNFLPLYIFFGYKANQAKERKTQRKGKERATTPLGKRLLKRHSLTTQGGLLEEYDE